MNEAQKRMNKIRRRNETIDGYDAFMRGLSDALNYLGIHEFLGHSREYCLATSGWRSSLRRTGLSLVPDGLARFISECPDLA